MGVARRYEFAEGLNGPCPHRHFARPSGPYRGHVDERSKHPDPSEGCVNKREERSHAGILAGAVVQSAVRQNLILAFRLRFGPKGRRPEDYVKALVEAGGTVESIVTLGETTPDWAIQIGAPYAHILDAATTPTNANAHRVRKFWGWL